MSIGFPQSVRALSSDSPQRWLWGLTLALVMLMLWGGWLLFARLWVYVSTDQARMEAHELLHPVETQVGGRVIESHIVLGKDVEREEVLAILDSEVQRYQLEEMRASVKASEAELGELEKLVTAEERVLAQMGTAARAARKETEIKISHAETAAEFAEHKAGRLSDLKDDGHLPELDILGAEADAKKQRSLARAQRLAYERLVADQKIQTSERLLRIEQLRQQMIRLEGQVRIGEASIRRLETDIAKRVVRAPIAGRLGEVTDLPVGIVVTAGQRLAAIVPSGELKIVAHFMAHEALGRLEPGQKARLRLDAFPWTQYGSVVGKVARVSSEPFNGMVRTEIHIDKTSSKLIPYQHGLVGTVEVAVEQVSPAVLLLRSAGKLVGRPDKSSATKNHSGNLHPDQGKAGASR